MNALFRRGSQGARKRHPRRQVRARVGPCLRGRRAGPGAPADAAEKARCRVRPEHRRLHQRLSGLAARRLCASTKPSGEPRRTLATQNIVFPARRQRGARRDRSLGHAAKPTSIPNRRRSMASSASGTARGPASSAASMSSNCTPTWPAAPRSTAASSPSPATTTSPRARLAAHQGDHIFKARVPAGVLPVERAGHPRHGAARLRDEPVRRRLVEHEDDPGSGGVLVERVHRSRPRRHHPARRLPDAGRRPAHPLARRAARAGSAGH